MTTLRIVREDGKPYDSGEKRFHVQGTRLISPCPSCGVEREVDLGSRYLSYPRFGTDHAVTFYCEPCEEKDLPCNWKENVVVRVTVEPGTPTPRGPR